jgi:hypothetical protein
MACIVICRCSLLIGRGAVHVGEMEDDTGPGRMSILGNWFRRCGRPGRTQCKITEDGECVHASLGEEEQRVDWGTGELRYTETDSRANQRNVLGLPFNRPISASRVVEATTMPDVKMRTLSRRRILPFELVSGLDKKCKSYLCVDSLDVDFSIRMNVQSRAAAIMLSVTAHEMAPILE